MEKKYIFAAAACIVSLCSAVWAFSEYYMSGKTDVRPVNAEIHPVEVKIDNPAAVLPEKNGKEPAMPTEETQKAAAQKPLETEPSAENRVSLEKTPDIAPSKNVPEIAVNPGPEIQESRTLPDSVDRNENVSVQPQAGALPGVSAPVPEPAPLAPPEAQTPKQNALPDIFKQPVRQDPAITKGGPPLPPGYVVKPLPAFTPVTNTTGPKKEE